MGREKRRKCQLFNHVGSHGSSSDARRRSHHRRRTNNTSVTYYISHLNTHQPPSAPSSSLDAWPAQPPDSSCSSSSSANTPAAPQARTHLQKAVLRTRLPFPHVSPMSAARSERECTRCTRRHGLNFPSQPPQTLAPSLSLSLAVFGSLVISSSSALSTRMEFARTASHRTPRIGRTVKFRNRHQTIVHIATQVAV
jgi:hypothetical protein